MTCKIMVRLQLFTILLIKKKATREESLMNDGYMTVLFQYSRARARYLPEKRNESEGRNSFV